MIAKLNAFEKHRPQKSPLARNLTSELPLRDIVWSALERISARQKQPDEIVDGSSHVVNLDVHGMIDGQLFYQSIDSIVSVGQRQTKSSTVTPSIPELVAYVLGKLNHQTRQRILDDIPVEFAENHCQIPTVDPGLLEQTQLLLSRLRRIRTIESRGPVRCKYMLVD